MSEQKKTRLQMLEEAVARNPREVFARYALAMECLQAGDHATAESHFKLLLEANPEYVPGYQMYGQMLSGDGRNDEAKRLLAAGIAAATKSGTQHARSEMEALLAEL